MRLEHSQVYLLELQRAGVMIGLEVKSFPGVACCVWQFAMLACKRVLTYKLSYKIGQDMFGQSKQVFSIGCMARIPVVAGVAVCRSSISY